MLATLSDRGPDSAGFAVYGEGRGDKTKLTLRASSAKAMKEIAERIGHAFSDATIELHDTHAVIAVEDRSLPQRDHFQLEMDHFSDCVQANKEPLTPGEEGLKDLKIIEAIYESGRTGKPVKLA